jgi:hypothetical protein
VVTLLLGWLGRYVRHNFFRRSIRSKPKLQLLFALAMRFRFFVVRNPNSSGGLSYIPARSSPNKVVRSGHLTPYLLAHIPTGESTKAPRQHNNQHQHTHVTPAPSLNTRTTTDNDKAVANSTAWGGERVLKSTATQHSTAQQRLGKEDLGVALVRAQTNASNGG